MVVVPLATAVTRPVLETVATAGLELVQVYEAEGYTVAVSCSVPPIRIFVEVLFREMPATVMTQVADMPFCEAVMFAVPKATAVTLPLASTVATELLDEVQERLPVPVLAGHTVAVSVFLSPTCIV